MKVVNDGLQPVFCAGLRSLVAAFLILLWLFLTKKSVKVEKSLVPAILFYGIIFGAEFMFLYIALDTAEQFVRAASKYLRRYKLGCRRSRKPRKKGTVVGTVVPKAAAAPWVEDIPVGGKLHSAPAGRCA